MANTYTYYPEYRETSLKVAIDDYPIGTPTGFKYCYYIEDGTIKMCPQGQTGKDNFIRYFDENLISPINSRFNTYTDYIWWITEHYFTNPLEITGLIKPVISTLPNTGQTSWSRLKTLATNGNNALQIFFGVDRRSYNVSAGLYMCWIENGSVPPNGNPFDVTLCTFDPRISGETIEHIISEINTVLSGSKVYIVPNVRIYSVTSAQRQITTSDTIGLLVEFDGSYAYCYSFGNSSISSYSALNVSSESIIEPTPPEPPEPPTPGSDPYNPGGYSGGGGGPNPDGTGATGTGGLHDDSSDTISTPSLPSNVATSSGLFTAYNPSTSQLAYFADKLWNADPTTIGDLFRLLFGGDAFNSIIGLHLLPVQPDTGGSPNIMLGNWDSGAPAPKIVNQYKQVPFGSLMLPEYWGNSIDYSPYTRVQLALPYIGIVDVDTDDVIGSNNTLTYNIDVLSGAICATLHCTKGNLNSVIYQWSGSCAVSLPITGANYNSIMGAIAGVGAAVGGAVSFASGPMGAALGTAGSLAVGTGLISGSAANMFGSMKGKVQKSGSFGANSGALGIMTPYFIVTRPVQSVPSSWQVDKGYPANISAQLGTVTGYTEVSEINLECSGTEAEKKEIIDLLKKGVIF